MLMDARRKLGEQLDFYMNRYLDYVYNVYLSRGGNRKLVIVEDCTRVVDWDHFHLMTLAKIILQLYNTQSIIPQVVILKENVIQYLLL
jgi:hypothetical protein